MKQAVSYESRARKGVARDCMVLCAAFKRLVYQYSDRTAQDVERSFV